MGPGRKRTDGGGLDEERPISGTHQGEGTKGRVTHPRGKAGICRLSGAPLFKSWKLGCGEDGSLREPGPGWQQGPSHAVFLSHIHTHTHTLTHTPSLRPTHPPTTCLAHTHRHMPRTHHTHTIHRYTYTPHTHLTHATHRHPCHIHAMHTPHIYHTHATHTQTHATHTPHTHRHMPCTHHTHRHMPCTHHTHALHTHATHPRHP